MYFIRGLPFQIKTNKKNHQKKRDFSLQNFVERIIKYWATEY